MRVFVGRTILVLGAGLVATTLSCGHGDSTESTEGGGGAGTTTESLDADDIVAATPDLREIALSDAMERGRLSFQPRSEDSAFESGTDRWYARAERDGVALVPSPSFTGELPSGGLTVRTDEIRRGRWQWKGEGSFLADDSGALVREGHGAYEWYRGRDEGLEQGWTFEGAPGEQGAIVVTVAIEGARLLDSDPDGVHLATDAGPVRYGHGTWIDAKGVRTIVPSVWRDGIIELVVPEDVVTTSSYPATLDPVVGPEMSTDPAVNGPDDSDTGMPLVACTSTTCMGMWKDAVGLSRIRFTPDGTLLDPVPTTHAIGSDLEVVGVGAMADRFVLGWVTGTSSTENLHVRVYDETGTAVSGDVVLSANTDIANWNIGCSPDRCLVTWRAPGSQVLSKRIDASGAVLDPFGTLIDQSTASSTQVAYDGANFFVAYSTRVRRLTPSGIILDASPIIPFSAQSVTGLASSGAGVLAVGTNSARIINADGTLGGSAPNPGLFLSSVVWTGTEYLATQSSPPTGQRYDSTAAPVGSPITYQPLALNIALTARPGGAFLRSGGLDALAQRVDASGATLGPAFPLNAGSNPQHQPVVVAGNNQYLVAWADRRLGNYAVYGQRYDASGAAMDQTPLVLVNGRATSLDGAFDGTNYLIAAYVDNNYVRAARVPSSGPPLDPATGITVTSGSSNAVSVSWDGINFAVSYLFDDTSVSNNDTVRLRRVTPTGALLDGSALLVSQGNFAPSVSSAFDGVGHVIAWWSGGNAYYRRLTPGGTFTGPATLIGTIGVTAQAACGGSTCIVSDGVGARMLGGTAIALPAGTSSTSMRPALAFGGTEFLAVGANGSGDALALRISNTTPPAAIGSWFNVSQSPGQIEVSSSAASLGDGGALVAYERFVEADNASRVFLRAVILSGPNGSTCTSNGDCQSNHCTDGVCCDTACGNGSNTDCQACSSATGAAVNGTCGVVSAGTSCRTSAGDCDVAEVCDGSSSTCPADGFASNTTECRAVNGDCDVPEMCTGSSAACPVNAYAPSSAECRSAVGDCDVAEHCTGSGPTCPANAFSPGGTLCRAADGPCDVAETCSGGSADCPNNAFAPTSTICRPAAGLCDAPENCAGEAADCPSDALIPTGTVCRDADGECDAEDFCDGTSAACEDEGQPANTPCGPAPSGDCDLQDTCSGGPGPQNECVDWVYNENHVCRPVAGDCDVAEKCTAADYVCPDDEVENAGSACRPSSGPCDDVELCDGSNAECPDDASFPDGTECEDNGTCESGECVPNGEDGDGGAGGSSGDGGSSSSSGGSPGDGGDDASKPEDGGCDCRAAPGKSPNPPWAAFSAFAMLTVALRRRRVKTRRAA